MDSTQPILAADLQMVQTNYPWPHLLIWAVISLMLILAIWKLGLWMLQWWSTPAENPSQLFNKLARAHNLSANELQILQELRSIQPASLPPATLFVDPTVWFSSLESKPSNEGNPSSAPSSLDSKQALFLKIFGFEVSRFRY